MRSKVGREWYFVRQSQSAREIGFGIPTLESGNNPGTLRAPYPFLPCFCVPPRARKFFKFQIKVLCHGRGREFESRRPRHSSWHSETSKRSVCPRV